MAEVAPAHVAAAFESPKQAAHGDLAVHRGDAARQGAEEEPARGRGGAGRRRLNRQPAVQRWVEAIEIAGPGFINLRLRPARRQAIVGRDRGRRRRLRPPAAEGRQGAGRVRLGQPDRAAAPLAMRARRRSSTRSATCSRRQGWQVSREFYYNDARVQIATLANSVQARLRRLQAR
jgi:arginyl-tRNA synthetase